jgi:hypothetical protein
VTADLHKLSAGRADYYVREVARDHEEYLSGQGESPGEYLGGGNTALGKSGVCSEQEFRRLFAWRHPDPASSSAALPAATPCRPGTWCCGRSKTSPSCMP